MKKGDHFFLVQVAEGSEKYYECTRKRDVLDYVAYRKEKLSQGPIGRIITVQMVGEWEVEQVVMIVPKVEDEEPNDIDTDKRNVMCTNPKCNAPLAIRAQKCCTHDHGECPNFTNK